MATLRDCQVYLLPNLETGHVGAVSIRPHRSGRLTILPNSCVLATHSSFLRSLDEEITLSLTFEDRSRVADLSWVANRTQIVFATESLRSELERLMEDGLSEWVGPEEDPIPRMTPSSDWRFLERLAAYLRRQFRFVIKLQDDALVKRKDTLQWPRGSEASVRQAIGDR